MLPEDAKTRKQHPMCTGLLDYFPDALAEVARVSFLGNEQHNPGQPLHWAREKSTDHADCIVRHLLQRGEKVRLGSGTVSHTAQAAWRALALLQEELEAEAAAEHDEKPMPFPPSPPTDPSPAPVSPASRRTLTPEEQVAVAEYTNLALARLREQGLIEAPHGLPKVVIG